MKQLVASESLARGMPLSGSAEAQLEEAILACYARRGITGDPATFDADVPDLRAVAAYLAEQDGDASLRAALDLFTQGLLGRLLHGPRPLPLAIPPSRPRLPARLLRHPERSGRRYPPIATLGAATLRAGPLSLALARPLWPPALTQTLGDA